MTKLDLSIARRVIAAAEKHAEKIGVPMNVAVVDEGGNLVAFERMAGAWRGSSGRSGNWAPCTRHGYRRIDPLSCVRLRSARAAPNSRTGARL